MQRTIALAAFLLYVMTACRTPAPGSQVQDIANAERLGTHLYYKEGTEILRGLCADPDNIQRSTCTGELRRVPVAEFYAAVVTEPNLRLEEAGQKVENLYVNIIRIDDKFLEFIDDAAESANDPEQYRQQMRDLEVEIASIAEQVGSFKHEIQLIEQRLAASTDPSLLAQLVEMRTEFAALTQSLETKRQALDVARQAFIVANESSLTDRRVQNLQIQRDAFARDLEQAIRDHDEILQEFIKINDVFDLLSDDFVYNVSAVAGAFREEREVVANFHQLFNAVVADTSGFTYVGAGASHACTLSNQGLMCWGTNSTHQVGVAGSEEQPIVALPTRPTIDIAFKRVDGGTRHTCGITAAGEIYCWGAGTTGQLGYGQLAHSVTPVRFGGNETYSSFATGSYFTCAVKDGKVYCSGRRLIDHRPAVDEQYNPLPVEIPSISGVTQIAAGAGHLCALTSEPSVICIGAHNFWQTGSRRDFNQIAFPRDVIPQSVHAGGGYHTCVLDQEARSLCWGNNRFGQLGQIVNRGDQYFPDPLPTRQEHKWKSLTLGLGHTCGIDLEDRTLCFGRNENGQLGNGRTDSRAEPALVGIEGETFTQLNAGGDFTCGITASKKVFCWGRGQEGQLGNNQTNYDHSTPVEIRLTR